MTTIKQGSLVELEIDLMDGEGEILETTAEGEVMGMSWWLSGVNKRCD